MTRPALPDNIIQLANDLADISRPIALNYYRSGLAIEDKGDLSPVTKADREIEAALRERIEATFPTHGIFGEEYGIVRADADFVWVLDPIDGTKAFVTGKPLFGTLIGLVHKGEIAYGVVDIPALGDRWAGGRDNPTIFNGEPAKVRNCAQLSDAWMYATTPDMFVGADEAPYKSLSQSVKHPLYGSDCYAYGLLASGHVDLVVEAMLKPYDYCAPAAIIEGAGGFVTDWQGKPLGLSGDGKVIAANTQSLLDATVACLNEN